MLLSPPRGWDRATVLTENRATSEAPAKYFKEPQSLPGLGWAGRQRLYIRDGVAKQ